MTCPSTPWSSSVAVNCVTLLPGRAASLTDTGGNMLVLSARGEDHVGENSFRGNT